jgi:hypothetical protein
MDHAAIDAVAKQAGVLEEAFPDVRARVQAHFAGQDPSPQAVQQWLTETLKSAAPHLYRQGPQPVWEALGLSKQAFDQMPPAWRLAQARAQQPLTTTPHARRPTSRTLTAEELDSIKDLPWHERHTRGRQLQQTPPPGQG